MCQILWRIILFTGIITNVQADVSQNNKVSEGVCSNGTGTWLVSEVCLTSGYQPNEAPNEAKIYSIFRTPKITEVNEKKKTLSFILRQSRLWEDSRIITAFSKMNLINGGLDVTLEDPPGTLNLPIWYPFLHIKDLSKESRSLYNPYWTSQIRILASNPFHPNITLVNLTIDWRVSIICEFDYSNFPFDNQMCHFREETRKSNVEQVLFDTENTNHNIKKFKAVGFHITITFFGNNMTYHDGTNEVGFDVHIRRLIQPYLLQFYLPCFAIVVVSQISFIIPLTEIPGRIVLIVTQFLTLTNIFIYQMVRSIVKLSITLYSFTSGG